MEASHFILLILLIANNIFIQELLATNLKDENLTLEKQLEIINKPATKSFLTKYGDIVDCVDINKQYAFDHPLLKNHTIQMKPTFVPRSSISTNISDFLPEDMRCPEGTVPVKRIRKEDLLMNKFTPAFPTYNNASNSVDGHEVAGIVALFKNLGASGTINVWNPAVKPDQYSAACIYVGSGDGPLINVIETGWMVSPRVYPNTAETRFYAYWTRDSGRTGCFNTLCPGFVQVSKRVFLGQFITPVSKRLSTNKLIDVEIRKDIRTGNWWVYYNGESVGYWPAGLFTTLANAATRAGWGGELYSPPNEEAPEMGSGFKADDKGYLEVAYMKNLQMLAPALFPKREDLGFMMTSPNTYTVLYNYADDWKNYIYFGGPKNK